MVDDSVDGALRGSVDQVAATGGLEIRIAAGRGMIRDRREWSR